MSFSYYNKGDVTLLPDGYTGCSTTVDGAINVQGSFSITTPIKTGDAYYSFYAKNRLSTFMNVWGDLCITFTFDSGKFTINRDTFSSAITGNHPSINGGRRIYCHFKAQDSGTLIEINIGGQKYSGVLTNIKTVPISITFTNNDPRGGYGCSYVWDIFISDTEIPAYAEYTHLTINDITNWEKGTDGNYLLTDVDKEGIIQLDNEQLTKLKQTSDIMSCYLCCQLEKKGSKLKTLQFSVGDKVGTYEIPVGTSTCYIPLTFDSPSDMQNVKVVIKG